MNKRPEPRTEVVVVWTANGTAVVTVIYDPANRAFDVHCSGADPGCGRFSTHLYDRGTTTDEQIRLRHTAKNDAFVHATNCYAGAPDADSDVLDRS
jgi:hypothetical protein